MQLNILAFAIPLFTTLMLVEYLIAKNKGLETHQLHNSIANVSIGIAERMSEVFVTGMFYFVYDYLQKNFGLFEIESGVGWFILLLLCTDFLWYWYHRLAHEINILWAVHVVHHQSEDFNYTVSARITVLQAFVRTGFWSFLPLLGFKASIITAVLLLHGIYPFFIHTQLINKLGILEYILVTPSHHRVHHCSNDEYLDKNYGDVFIIWDKLFGTFKKEDNNIKPVFGLTKPLNTYSFLWQHFHYFIELWIHMKSQQTLVKKVKSLFQKPETLSNGEREKAESIFKIKQVNGHVNIPLNKYVIWQMFSLLVAVFFFILYEHYTNNAFKTLFALIVMLTLINCGAIMEQKKWIFYIELMRCSAVVFAALYYFPVNLYYSVALVLVTVLIIGNYNSLQSFYLKWVYPKKYVPDYY